MIKKIINNDILLALVIPADHHIDGVHFFTPNDFSQQLALMKRPKNYSIPSHFHNKNERKVLLTQEVLFIRKGKMKVEIFNEDLKFVDEVILTDGDVILLANGGHGFKMLEETDFIEVKQGPYSGEKDKTLFPGVNNE